MKWCEVNVVWDGALIKYGSSPCASDIVRGINLETTKQTRSLTWRWRSYQEEMVRLGNEVDLSLQCWSSVCQALESLYCAPSV